MKKTFLKALALLLAVLMLSTNPIGTVYAADVPVSDENELRTAIANANDGDVISIDNDINLATGGISINKNITLTSSGNYTLNVLSAAIYVNTGNVKFNGSLKVTGSGNVVVYVGPAGRVAVEGDASVEQTDTTNTNSAIFNDGGVINITGGTVNATGTGVNGYGIRNVNGGVLRVAGGTIHGSNTAIENTGTLTVSGGAIGSTNNDAYGIAINDGTAEISSGSINGSYCAVFAASGTTVNIFGGNFTAGSSAYSLNCSGTANLTGGNFYSRVATTGDGDIHIDLRGGGSLTLDNTGVNYEDNGGPKSYLGNLPAVPITAIEGQPSAVSLTGAENGVVFAVDSSTSPELGATATGTSATGSGSTVVANMAPTAAGNYNLVLTAAGTDLASTQSIKLTLPVTVNAAAANVCKIGAKEYTSLNAALADVPSGGAATIQLLTTLTHTDPVVIDGKDITFNLDSFNLTIDTSATSYSTALKVINAGSVDCTGSGKLNVIGSRYGVYAHNYSSLSLYGDVVATGLAGSYPGTGVYASGGGTTVTIDGSVTGDPYVEVSGNGKGVNDYDTNSSKPGYRQYGFSGSGENTVWVKIPSVLVWPASSSLTASGTTDTSTVLTWTAATGALDYVIYKNSAFGYGPGKTQTYTVTGLLPDTEYTFNIQAAYLPEGASSATWTTDGPSVTVRTNAPLPKAPTPSAVFTAIDFYSGTLSGLNVDMHYSVNNGGTWYPVYPITGGTKTIYNVTAEKGIWVKQAGDDITTTDSDIQTITVTQAAVPTGLSKADCTTLANNDGKLIGLSTEMEYMLLGTGNWSTGTGGEITGLTNGIYFVRVKADGTQLASEEAELAILPYGLTIIPVPTGNSGLKWTGSEQIGVNDGTGYTLSGTRRATDVSLNGYPVTATLQPGYAWDDGTTEVKHILWNIGKADGPAAPTGLAGVAPAAVGGSDGKITGTTTAMEYATNTGFTGAVGCSSNETTGLAEGTYYVRLKGTANHEAGAYATVTLSRDSSGGRGSSGGPAPASKYEADVTGGGSSVKIEVKADKNNASAELTAAQAQTVKGKDIDVTMPKISGVTAYTIGIPVPDLSKDSENASITLKTDAGSITLPSDMLTGTNAASGSKAQIRIGTVKTGDLPQNARDKVGNHPVISLSLSIDGKTASWDNPNAPVKVSIPYTPTAEELSNPDGLTVFYIDGSGKLIEMKDAKYDPKTKSVVFTTTHFSYYAVGYNAPAPAPAPKFSDVLPGAWYYDAVVFIAEKGITTGAGDGKFSPNATLTRGQFIVMLLKAYGIEADKNPTDNFADAGNTYYTGYLAAAKEKGIASGIGNNKFAPEQAITRQEMFTLLHNALKLLNKLPAGDSGKTLADFTDSGSVASWANEAMAALIKSGTVSGAGGKLDPAAATTRAQMAHVLYNLLMK